MALKRLAFILALSCSAGALQAQPASIPVDKSFSVAGVTDQNENGIAVFAKVIQAGDRVAICGVSAMIGDLSNASARQFRSQIVRKLTYKIGNARLRFPTGKFTKVDSTDDIPGAQAGCALTRTSWNPAFASEELRIEAQGTITVRD